MGTLQKIRGKIAGNSMEDEGKSWEINGKTVGNQWENRGKSGKKMKKFNCNLKLV